MLGQKEHELSDFLLFFPALADALQAFRPDTVDVQKKVRRFLKDIEGALLVGGHDSRRQLRADAADGSRSKVFFDPFSRRRMGRF